MKKQPELLAPHILVIDDEPQVQASIRLRIGSQYHLTSASSAQAALKAVSDRQFDLCFVDIHMPEKDGLRFIEEAANIDGDLGFVIISAFDSDENLHRAIPLQVYEFIGKPLPEREGFEARIPDWIARTRQRRREHALAKRAHEISQDL
jgi:YesN/AraC family two-component response regulator